MSLSTIRKMTLRLNMEEPKQAEIYQILTSLDKYIYKSQNQFLVDALEFYIEHSGKDMLNPAGAGRTAAIHHGRGTGAEKKGVAWGTAGRDEE